MTLDPVSVTTRLYPPAGDEPTAATRRLQLTESIDRPWSAVVDLVTDDLDLDCRALVGAKADLEVDRPGVTARTFGGIVTRAEYVATRARQMHLRVVIEPSLALLRYTRRRRIFADLPLPAVLDAVAGPVFEAHGGAWDLSRVTGELLPRDYLVQYDETDLDFVLRVLGDAGLCLLHGIGPERGETTYVLTDANSALVGAGMDPGERAESQQLDLVFDPEGEEEANEPSVQYLGRWDGLHTQSTTVTARNWKTPGGHRYETRVDRGPLGEAWTYHPYRLDEGQGSDGPTYNQTEAWAVRLLDEHHASGSRFEVTGRSNVADLAAGSTFELSGHPNDDLDQPYAVLSVVHHAEFPDVELGSDSEVPPTYANQFMAAHLDAGTIRPPLRPKPAVQGIESAVVVGPEGEEVHTDALGRVRVRFHWDTLESQTCWLRVLSPWAGPGYGAIFIPRVGMEVAVSFLGGDPDRPVVSGCLYTGTNTPPGALPHTKTQTVLRTQSTPGGEGFNELRFEDAAGSEEVYLHAQRNQRTEVRAQQSTRVGASRTLSVGKDSTRTIGGSETVHIGKDGEGQEGHLDVAVTGSERRSIFKDHELSADSALWRLATTLYADATDEVRISCAEHESVLTMDPKAIVLTAPESIELRVGRTTLKLTPKGIELNAEIITADAQRQMWLASPAGWASLNGQGVELFGGSKSESRLRLQAQQAELKTTGILTAAGKAAIVTGREHATVEAPSTRVAALSDGPLTMLGGAVALHGTTVDVHGKGVVDVRGLPIKLNS